MTSFTFYTEHSLTCICKKCNEVKSIQLDAYNSALNKVVEELTEQIKTSDCLACNSFLTKTIKDILALKEKGIGV